MVRHHPKMIELSMFCIMEYMKSEEKIIGRILKIKIELIKHENANATTRPIGFQIFENLRKLKNFQDFDQFLIASASQN